MNYSRGERLKHKIKIALLFIIFGIFGLIQIFPFNFLTAYASNDVVFILDATDQSIITGIASPENYDGVLVIPEYVTGADGQNYNVTKIKSNAANNTFKNITGLDLTNATYLNSIVRCTFQDIASLSGKITFPASLTSLARDAFSGTSVTEFEFLGEVTDSIVLERNIPASLTKLVVPITSKDKMIEKSTTGDYVENFKNVDILYWDYVSINNQPTTLRKTIGTNFTSEDYDLLSKDIDKFDGFVVGGSLYNASNFSTLRFAGDSLAVKYKEAKTTYDVNLESGKGYNLSGESEVEENATYVANLTIDKYYSESQFKVVILDNAENPIEFNLENTAGGYKISIENVTSEINIKIEGVVLNDFSVSIISSPNKMTYDIDDEIILTANVVGNVPVEQLTYKWTQTTGAEVEIESNNTQLNLANLPAGTYTFVVEVKYVYNSENIVSTNSINITVNEVYYNVTFVSDNDLCSLLKEFPLTVAKNDDYVFQFDINEYYSESDYMVSVYNTLTLQPIEVLKDNQMFLIKNVCSDITINVTGLTKNTLDVELLIEGHDIADRLVVGENIKIISSANTGMPMEECVITWKVNDQIITEQNLNTYVMGVLPAGNYIVECVWDFYNADITDIETIEFTISKVVCSAKLQKASYEFNNIPYDYPLSINYPYADAKQEIILRKYIYKSNAWEAIDEIKNVGRYKLELDYDTNIVEFTSDSITSCVFDINPRVVDINYSKSVGNIVYDGKPHYIEYNIGIDIDSITWKNYGLTKEDVKENLYCVKGDVKTLIYSLSVYENNDSFMAYADKFTDAGEYYFELTCDNKNFVLKTNSNKFKSVTYTIVPYVVSLNANINEVFKSTSVNPYKVYEIEVKDKIHIVTVYYTREQGTAVGKYAITGILKIDMPTENLNNFTFTINNKTAVYVVDQKPVEVIWDTNREYVYDGEYHLPNATVNDSDVVITITGKQYLPNKPKTSYTATASCDNSDYKLLNSTVKFTINSTTITTNKNSQTVAYVESAQGFNPNYSLSVTTDAKAENNFMSYVSKGYSSNVNILGAYTVKVVNLANTEVSYAETVDIKINKPEYFSKSTKVLEILADGTTREVSFEKDGNTLKLNDVHLGASFVFVNPTHKHTVLIIALVTLSLVLAGACVWLILKNKKFRLGKHK